MASVIKIKRSSTATAVPNSLEVGEIAVNLFDRKLYVGNTTGVTAIGGEDFRLTTQDSGSEGAYIKLIGDSVLSTNSVFIEAGEGIDITRQSNGSITIAGEDASSSNKGVASFDSGDFSVSSGAVTLADSASGAVIGINGTSNEVTVSRTNGTVTVGLPDDVTVAGQLNVGENIIVTGNVEVGGTFSIQGATQFTGGVDVNGTAALNAITCTTLGANGNVTIGGTLTTTGLTTLNGGITADGGAFTVADTSGNIGTTGTLTVGGLTTLNGGITADGGAFTVADTSGNIGTTGTLTVAGTSSLNGVTATTFTANSDATISGQLNVGENVVVTGNTAIGGNLTVDGNLTVEGALTYISTSTVYADDGMFKLSANNSGDTVDTGIYAMYVDGVTTKYAGYFRDAGDDVFKFYTDLQDEPSTTVNTAGTGYTLAQVDCVIDGGTY